MPPICVYESQKGLGSKNVGLHVGFRCFYPQPTAKNFSVHHRDLIHRLECVYFSNVCSSNEIAVIKDFFNLEHLDMESRGLWLYLQSLCSGIV